MDYTWTILNVPKGTGMRSNLAYGDNLENYHEYPQLHQEMPMPLQLRYMSFMYEATGLSRLAAVLSGAGAHLYGLEWARQVSTATTLWLAEYW